MSAADIRLLVERCYDPEAMQRVIAHRGNPLDGLNPNAITFLNSNLFDALEIGPFLLFG